MKYKVKIWSESEVLREFDEIYGEYFSEFLLDNDIDEEKAILIALKEDRIVAYS
tara:strand:- start:224 stop:385 length:162 start_codon:yes stop_codon:yes gene_type:complete